MHISTFGDLLIVRNWVFPSRADKLAGGVWTGLFPPFALFRAGQAVADIYGGVGVHGTC
jgi:hypothetical protein